MGKKPPLQLFTDDFYMDTAAWSTEEVGVYTRLLLYQWINNSLPEDKTRLARIAGCSSKKFQKVWSSIKFKFIQIDDGKIQNLKMEEHRVEGKLFRMAKSTSGKISAEKKWGDRNLDGLSRSERLTLARLKGRHTREEFQEMVNFFSGFCVKCGGGKNDILRDHIIPIYQGGSDAITNLQPLCMRCNTGKGSDNTDYRISYCIKHNLKMPNEWIEMPNKMPNERLTSFSNSILKDKELKATSCLSEEIQKRLTEVCERLYQNGWKKAPAFLNAMAKKKYHPEAILKTLEQCEKNNPEEPWAYGLQIIKVESQNFNARDFYAEEKERLKDPETVGDLVKGIGRPIT